MSKMLNRRHFTNNCHRIGGDHCVNYDMVDLGVISPSILTAIDKLRPRVRISIDCYVHGWNRDALWNRVFGLDSLRACLTSVPALTHELQSRSIYDIPSSDIAGIILRNPGLKHLHLCHEKSPAALLRAHYESTKYGTLESIGSSVQHLESLVLEGRIRFSPRASKMWGSLLKWNQLRSLSVAHHCLIGEISDILKGRLTSFATLKFSVYKSFRSTTGCGFLQDLTNIYSLSTLKLKNLALLGFPRDIIRQAMKYSGATIRRLRFHVRENATQLKEINGRRPHYASPLLLSAHLEILRHECPMLEWIGLDVLRENLAGPCHSKQLSQIPPHKCSLDSASSLLSIIVQGLPRAPCPYPVIRILEPSVINSLSRFSCSATYDFSTTPKRRIPR